MPDRNPHSIWKAALLFVGFSLLYLATRSPGLDEWDSVQFAMGVRHFDIWAQQPHPPGYPLYIFLGWVGHTLFGFGPVFALQSLSCLGGGLFVACWFLIVRLEFGERCAWLVALSLGVAAIVWMTSTKTMTDSLATGLLSAELLLALHFRRGGGIGILIGAAFCGAASAGVRPQLVAVAFLVVILALRARRAPARWWFLGLGSLFAGCLGWLGPMWYLQAQLRPELAWWTVYPTQVYGQWRWRLDRPNVYIGAGSWSPIYLGTRFGAHILGWLSVGLGLIENTCTIVVGSFLILFGFGSYARHFSERDRKFWRANWAWVALHVAIIFCCLPAAQRYYLIITPLVLISLGRGLMTLPGRWRGSAPLLPVLLLGISIPLVMKHHTQDGPPLLFARYLERHYPPNERSDVLLLLSQTRRHVQWYAPGFELAPKDQSVAATPLAELLQAKAIYTDDPKIALRPGWKLVRRALYHRSILIAPKHRSIGVYQVERTMEKPAAKPNPGRPEGPPAGGTSSRPSGPAEAVPSRPTR